MILQQLYLWHIYLFTFTVSAFKNFDLVNERPENFHLEQVTVFNKTFMVGSVHYDWVLKSETGPLQVLNRALNKTDSSCLAIDVGMNDGFFTQLAAQYGCKVYAFEVQESCIALSRKAVAQNNISHFVSIFRLPVSAINGELLMFPHGPPDQQKRCDGMNSINGNSHKHYTRVGFNKFHAVSLDAFVPFDVKVDFLKVDVEGFDPSVMQGAMGLFMSHRIQRAVIEIQVGFWDKSSMINNLSPYRRIIEEFGYKFRCVTETPKNMDWGVIQENLTYHDFDKYVRGNNCVDWEFYLP